MSLAAALRAFRASLPPRARRGLPIGLAHGVDVIRPVAHGSIITYDDVGVLPDNAAARCRQQLENSAGF